MPFPQIQTHVTCCLIQSNLDVSPRLVRSPLRYILTLLPTIQTGQPISIFASKERRDAAESVRRSPSCLKMPSMMLNRRTSRPVSLPTALVLRLFVSHSFITIKERSAGSPERFWFSSLLILLVFSVQSFHLPDSFWDKLIGSVLPDEGHDDP